VGAGTEALQAEVEGDLTTDEAARRSYYRSLAWDGRSMSARGWLKLAPTFPAWFILVRVVSGSWMESLVLTGAMIVVCAAFALSRRVRRLLLNMQYGEGTVPFAALIDRHRHVRTEIQADRLTGAGRWALPVVGERVHFAVVDPEFVYLSARGGADAYLPRRLFPSDEAFRQFTGGLSAFATNAAIHDSTDDDVRWPTRRQRMLTHAVVGVGGTAVVVVGVLLVIAYQGR
jgi:hypothetical protein